MISPTRSLALLALVVLASLPSGALAQRGSALGSPTGEPASAPTPPPPPQQSAEQVLSDSGAAEPPAEGAQPEAQESEPGTEAPEAATAGETADSAPTHTDGERMRLIVIDAATFGIDPVVGRVASARMRATGEEMGYHVLTPEESVAAAQQLRMPYPPTPADLWRVAWVARTHRGAFARIWAHAGQYVIEVAVASLDGTGPFFARGTAGADDLREVVDRLLRSALPGTDVWATGPTSGAPSEAEPRAIDEIEEDTPRAIARRRRAESEPELRRWQLTLQTEGAIGAAQEVFYNHLVGLRFDFRITRDILIGAYAAYANLNARDGRANNILLLAQFENRIRISPDIDVTIPLRAAAGYLPRNGPVLRLAVGVNYAIDEHWEIGADLLTPTFWFLPNRTAVSLNIGLEATYRF